MATHILFEGISQLDHQTPITVLAVDKSSNTKTGDMVQTYILRSDMSPLDAVREAQDAPICGDCVFAGGNGCYVNVAFGPMEVWKRYRDGLALRAKPSALGAKRMVRLGAYGDPAAAPFELWDALLRRSVGHTGYTHQWKTCDQRFRSLCMASVENEEDLHAAHMMGWRTYRVVQDYAHKVKGEVVCPSERISCHDCGHCDGTARQVKGSVVIQPHGFRLKKAMARVAAPAAAA